MDTISWQEIAIRLLFASILGSATAIAKRWYQTKQFIQSNALMALGASMFSILAGLTSISEPKLSSQLILGVSIVCLGVSLRKQDSQGVNIDPIMRLWCAGAVGSIVGLGFFVPAYVAIFVIILTNLIFPTPETNFVPNIENELKNNSNSKTEPIPEPTPEPIIARETIYQCHVSCLAVDEAEVLALLVQLGKEQKLRPTKISSRSLINENTSAEIEIWVDFISEGNSSPLQLQQVLINLKSQLNVGSAGWLNLSSEFNNKNEEIIHKN